MTVGSIWKKILLFALPLLAGNVFQQLYNTVDALIVGRFLDETSLAAVASSGSLIFLLVGFIMGVGTGAGVMISKYFGAGDREGLHLAVHTDIAFGFTAGILLSVVGVLLAPQILIWMGTPANVLPNSTAYIRLYFAGGLFIVLYNISMGILQAVGDSRHPLYYLMISSGVNICLDLLFIAGFGWGVWSAALATTLSQSVSVILCLHRLTVTKTEVRLNWREIRFHLPSLRAMLRLGLPTGMQNSIISIANVVVQSNINAFGELAMAGCGAYFKLEGFVFLPITCFSMALSTFVSQNLGARRYDRVRQGTVFGVVCSIVMAELIGVTLFVHSPTLVALFNTNPDVIDFGVRQAHVEALFFFVLAFSHCVAGILRGAGKAIVPMLVMLVVWCVFRISYITVLVSLIPRIECVFSAYPVTWTISAVVFLVYYLKGDWMHSLDRV